MSEWPRTVTTTMQPTQPIQVDEAEYTDLARQGLLIESLESAETVERLRVARARKVE